MTCPNCRLINPPTAQRCDCGYDFKTQSIQTLYFRHDSSVRRPASGEWIRWLVAVSLFQVLSAMAREAGMWPVAIILLGGLLGYLVFLATRNAGLAPGKIAGDLVIEEARPVEPAVERDMGDQFFDYYLDPHPEHAPGALMDCIEKGVFRDPENVVWYLFVRVARDNPWLVRRYEALFLGNSEGRLVVLKVLQQVGDEETRRFLEQFIKDPQFAAVRIELQAAVEDWPVFAINPLVRPVSSRADLDLLWCEFRATGSTEPVLRIIDVFERPDRIRMKLEDWLHEPPPTGRLARFLWTQRRIRLARRLRLEASILCDLDRNEVLSPEDLDCHCVMEGMTLSQGRALKIAKLLPFSLYGEDAHLCFKAAARWSLASHAREHAIVRHLCKFEAAKRTGTCRTLLEEVIAQAPPLYGAG